MSTTCLLILICINASVVCQIPKSYDLRKEHPQCVLPIENQGDYGSSILLQSMIAVEETSCIQHRQRRAEQDYSVDFVETCCPGQCTRDSGLLIKYLETRGTINSTDCNWKKTSSCSSVEHCKRLRTAFIRVNGTQVVDKIQTSLMRYGPVVAFVDAGSTAWQMYDGGVIMANQCNKNLDDTVMIVGWDVTSNGTPYWIVANTWGSSWGLNGYAWVQRGANACGIELFDYLVLPRSS